MQQEENRDPDWASFNEAGKLPSEQQLLSDLCLDFPPEGYRPPLSWSERRRLFMRRPGQ